MSGKDGIFYNDFEQVMVSTQLTSTKTDMNVIDLGSAGIQEVVHNGSTTIVVSFDAISTADGSNFFTFDLFHADAAASGVALTDAELVTFSNGLTNSASPTVKATTLTTQAQKLVLIGYTGIKRFLQLQPTETGTSDITINVHAFYGQLDSIHGDKLD